jgi:hypothetical protein
MIQQWSMGLKKSLDLKRLLPAERDKVTIKSRTDLSKARTRTELKNTREATGKFGNKGYYGLPLPLIPDIRATEVLDGAVGRLLEVFGVKRKYDRKVNQYSGPNRKANRYLIWQYKRLIKTLEGKTVEGNSTTAAHVIWKHNFYKISGLTPQELADKRDFEREKREWVELKTFINMKEPTQDGDTPSKNCIKLTDVKARIQRKKHKKIGRTYWVISNQLIRKSTAFRMAVLNKSKLGKTFHNMLDIRELFVIYQEIQEIADKFSTDMKLQRLWINTQLRDGSYKWRPLGLSSWAWRIYTRGINNLLETYIAAGWPCNQHGYKSGRGVHTIWNQVFTSVIHAKNIFEFDFAGFFNTVNVEAVGTVLHRFNVPKYMIASLLLISSGDIRNISIDRLLYLNKTKKPEEAGWLDAWYKYEYIHKFRKGYRHRGLAQGGVLSPLLSVLTLIVLDELEEHEIKYILYCDDGLMYSEHYKDFMAIAQNILDKHNIGATFAVSKSKWIKREEVWLSVLKLVGLEYNPWTDILSAATRNGATLKLEVGAIGFFTEGLTRNEELPKLFDDEWYYWGINNKELFRTHEKLFVESGRPYEEIAADKDKLAALVYKTMRDRLVKFDPWKLSDIMSEARSDTFIEFLFPIRLLKSMDKQLYHEIILKYEDSHAADFPYDLIIKNQELLDMFWMDKKINQEALAENITEKRSYYLIEESTKDLLLNNTEKVKKFDSKACIDTLSWFSDLPTIPEAVKSYFKDGQCELGEWLKITLQDTEIESLPADIIKHLKEKTGWFGTTKINWRNLYMDPAFATFIARLFQNSFSIPANKQNFKLEHDHEKENIIKLLHRYIGKQDLRNIVDIQGLNVFNATSICSSLLVKLSKVWTENVISKRTHSVPPYLRVYTEIIRKIANRRATVDMFMIPSETKVVWDMEFYREKKYRDSKGKMRPLRGMDSYIYDNYPLDPQELFVTLKHQMTKKHILHKYREYTPLHINAINRSAISLQAMHSSMYKDFKQAKFRNTTWDTYAPKSRLITNKCIAKSHRRRASPVKRHEDQS